jgi:hypothetical protein
MLAKGAGDTPVILDCQPEERTKLQTPRDTGGGSRDQKPMSRYRQRLKNCYSSHTSSLRVASGNKMPLIV